ncbi:rcc01693 family protein [Jannaschia sp. LMIT008]|uniref:rcc01693 family protein n=1 Tax=Jannaschia maritima TaxID=3032585 RepID=UPI002811949F|nr:rcc01693 family protein [Jannaschia sp. LMIT008]
MILPWPDLMRAGLRDLKLEPRVFWDLTPAELLFLLGDGAGGAPMRTEGLRQLMARFPDETEDDHAI